MFQPGSSLTIENASAVANAGAEAVRQGQAEIDLSTLTSFDSSAVAAMLAWQRAAREAGRPLSFLNIPRNLQSLAELYGVNDLLKF